MTFQFLELIFFAVLAFTIINKLISILGTTNEGEEEKYKSFFGEKATIKDIAAKDVTESDNAEWAEKNEDINLYILSANSENIIKNIKELQSKLASFNVANFVKSSKSAFELILDAFKDEQKLSALVDKRYLEKFQALEPTYESIKSCSKLEAKISECYSFGNNIFIKILFTLPDNDYGGTKFAEEWTFSKSLLVNTPNWYLNNVEKVSD